MNYIKTWIKVFTFLLFSTLFGTNLHAVTFDWQTEGGGWPAGDLSKNYTDVAGSGIDMNVTIVGTIGELLNGYPATDADGLNLRVDYSDKDNFVTLTMKFSTPVTLSSLKLKDFDTGTYVDRSVVSAVDTEGNTVSPSSVTLGNDVQQNAPGDYEAKAGTNNQPGDTDGQVDIQFQDVAVTEVSWTYQNGDAASDDPGTQYLWIDPVIFKAAPILSMTKASSVSGDIAPGEIFTYTVVVENDAAALVSATNVTVSDPLPVGVTYVSESTVAIGPVGTTTSAPGSYLDEFTERTYSNSDGLTSWTSSWVETGDDGSPTSGDIRVNNADDLRLQDMDTDKAISREMDLSIVDASQPVILSWNWQRDNGNESIRAQLFVNNNWVEVDSTGTGGTSGSETHTLTAAQITGTTALRFVTDSNNWNNTERIDVDDVQLSFTENIITTIPSTLDNNSSTGNAKLLDGDLGVTDDTLVLAGDNFILAPGESMTVTFQVTADDNLTNIPNIINTAFASSDEFTGEINATAENSTVPVTISYVYPQLNGSTLDLDFSTATETANAGFNVYAVKGKGKGKKWIKLNVEPIDGALDSQIPLDYQVSLELPDDMNVKKIGIAGVDVNGKEDRHGPFKIGRESGVRTSVVPVDWKEIKAEVKKDRKARKAKRKAKRKNRIASQKVTNGLVKAETINLEVKKDAVYRITHEDLLAEDIDLRGLKANRIAISLKGKGVERYIGVINKKGKWTRKSYIEFKGEKPQGRDALYVKSNNYRISLNRSLVVKSESIEPVTQKELVFETDNSYALSIAGEDPFYDAFFYTWSEGATKSLTRTFELSEVPQGDVEVTVYLSALSETTHQVQISLNGNQVANIQEKGWMDLPVKIDGTALEEGSNTLTITTVNESGKYDGYTYDKIVISYDDGEAQETQRATLSLRDKITKDSILPPRGTEYVIVSHPMFMTETLDSYISQKEGEGWNIHLVNVEDIYNAYGYGMATPEAIKFYFDGLREIGVTHVQLVGSASYDYLDTLKLGSVNFIGSLYVKTGALINYTPCDACLVADENGLPELAIGRWPVRTAADLEAVISKSLTWQNSGQSQAHSALFISDKKDEALNLDFTKQMETLYKQFESTGTWYDLSRVYLDEYITQAADEDTGFQAARDDIMKILSDGVSVTSYSGHSGTSTWSFEGLLKQDDIVNITNEGQTTIALPLACYTTYADSPSIKTLAHQFLVEGKHGAVAVYGAATLSSFSDNGVSAKKVIAYLLKGETIGEAVRKAKVDLGTSYMDVVRNSNLLGDVTLRVE